MFREVLELEKFQTEKVTFKPQGHSRDCQLLSRTFAEIVSSELLGFCFLFFLICSSLLCRVLD